MAKRAEFTRPIVRCGACFHADQATRQFREEGQHLCTPKLPGDHDLAGDIDAMHLKHVLGEINPERANLHVDGPLM
jgi:hypothetical protein